MTVPPATPASGVRAFLLDDLLERSGLLAPIGGDHILEVDDAVADWLRRRRTR